MTIVDTLADEHYRDRRRLAMEFARVINEEARELVALGLDVLQLDEPAFNVYMDDVRAWGIDALHRAIDGLACKTAVHICYGYGIKANIDWKATLGREWRQYEQTFPALAASRIDQISRRVRQLARARALLGLLRGKDVHGRRDRRRDEHRRDAGAGRGDDPARSCRSCRPSASIRARIAAWCRSPARWRAASCGRWPPAPRSCGESSARA